MARKWQIRALENRSIVGGLRALFRPLPRRALGRLGGEAFFEGGGSGRGAIPKPLHKDLGPGEHCLLGLSHARCNHRGAGSTVARGLSCPGPGDRRRVGEPGAAHGQDGGGGRSGHPLRRAAGRMGPAPGPDRKRPPSSGPGTAPAQGPGARAAAPGGIRRCAGGGEDDAPEPPGRPSDAGGGGRGELPRGGALRGPVLPGWDRHKAGGRNGAVHPRRSVWNARRCFLDEW